MLDGSKQPTLLFFGATFAVAWPCFAAVAILSHRIAAGGAHAAVQSLLLFVGVFAPGLVAIGLTAKDTGRGGVVALLEPLLAWRSPLHLYVFALGFMASVKLVAAVLHRLAVGTWPTFGGSAWYLILVSTLLSTVLGGQAGEEVGWRGFALPRLAATFGYPVASVVLGIIWALWHLPLFFVAGADTEGQSFMAYAVQVTGISVAMAWLYLRSRGSLLLTMLMHSAINQSKDIVPSRMIDPPGVFSASASTVAWMTAGVLAVCATFFLVAMRRSRTQVRPDA